MILKQRGRTREWLSQFCGLKQSATNHYLSGVRVPPLPTIKLIALALNTSEKYLLGQTDDPSPQFDPEVFLKLTGS